MSKPSPQKPEALLNFGGFTLNLQRRGLYRGEDRIRLTAKPLESLIYLVENCGRVVTKKELLDAVWKGTFVTEDVLVHAIREIRRALGDDRDNPRFILTIPREGYRFVCEVVSQPAREVLDENSSNQIVESPQQVRSLFSTPMPDQSSPRPDLTLLRQWRPKKWWFALAAGVVVIASVFLIPWRSVSEGFWPTPKPAVPKWAGGPILMRLKYGSAGKPALSGDGKWLVYVGSNEEDNETSADGKVKTFGDLFVKNLEYDLEYQITHQENPSGDLPVFTADSNFVVFANYPKSSGSSLPNLYKVGTNGGRFDKNNNPLPLNAPAEPFIPQASGAGFSPDQQWIAYTKYISGRKVLWRSPAADPESEHKEVAPHGFTPRWSPDGKWLAYTTSNPEGGPGDIFVIDSTTLSNARNVTNSPRQIYGLTWTHDGKFLIFSSKHTGPSLLWSVPVEGGVSEPITGPAGDFSSPSMSAASNMIVYSRYNGLQNVFVAEDLAAPASSLTKFSYHEYLRLSPSGQLLASVVQQPDFGEHLYVTDLDGTATCLTQHASHHPAWIDDKHLLYLKWNSTAQQTEVVELDVTDLKRPVSKTLTAFDGKVGWLDVNSAQNVKLAVVLTTGEKQQVVVRDLTTNRDEVIATVGEFAHLRWSADGSMLAWSGPAQSANESAGIWVLRYQVDKDARRIVDDGFGPVWGSSNSVIYFVRTASQAGLYEFEFGTNPRKLRDFQQTSYFDVVGQRLVYCELSSNGPSLVYSQGLQ